MKDLITLKLFQEQAVSELLANTRDPARNILGKTNKIIMSAPTGSGKTIILISFIEKFLEDNPDYIVCWFSPGIGKLHDQSQDKLEKFSDLNSGDINSILYNGGFQPETTYFINWEVITKKDNIALKQAERLNFLEHVRRAHNNGYKFLIVIDEEHYNKTYKSQDIIFHLQPTHEVRVSATPKAHECQVIISEKDVINEELITRYMHINKDLNNNTSYSYNNEVDILLTKADQMRKEISQAYRDLGKNINPLVMIQFPNQSEDLIKYVEDFLADQGYTYENKCVAQWFAAQPKDKKDPHSQAIGERKKNLDNPDITKNNSQQCFLLFKQAIATGWDCPRAKILVKLRNNLSETFEIQVLGRLRRMPEACHYDNEILNCSYLYTFDDDYRYSVLQSTSNAFETETLFLKPEAKEITLKKRTPKVDSFHHNLSIDSTKVRSRLIKFIRKKYGLVDDFDENRRLFKHHGYILDTHNIHTSYISGYFEDAASLRRNQFTTNEMKVRVTEEVHIREYKAAIERINKYIKLTYNETDNIIKSFFNQKHRATKNKLLELDNKEFLAFILNNKEILKDLFEEFATQEYQYMELRTTQLQDFAIPEHEVFKLSQNISHTSEIQSNVYQGYTERHSLTNRSSSEYLLEKYCEEHPQVKFVYKNGDHGSRYLSIPYQDNFGAVRFFYPDYVLQLTDGTIWIIETKGGETKYGQSKNIDGQSINKFNVLRNYAQECKYQFAFVRDIQSKLYFNNTEYHDDMSHASWRPLEEAF